MAQSILLQRPPQKLNFLGLPKTIFGASHRFCTPNINCRFPPL